MAPRLTVASLFSVWNADDDNNNMIQIRPTPTPTVLFRFPSLKALRSFRVRQRFTERESTYITARALWPRASSHKPAELYFGSFGPDSTCLQ